MKYKYITVHYIFPKATILTFDPLTYKRAEVPWISNLNIDYLRENEKFYETVQPVHNWPGSGFYAK